MSAKAKKILRPVLISLIAALIFVGIGLLVWPSFTDWWNARHQSRVIATYIESAESLDESEYAEILEAAAAYNTALFTSGHRLGLSEDELAEYEAQLTIPGTDVMAYLEIEKIDVYLPVYHGTDEAVLQSGIGHLEGSSLPVGGESTHCVLTGHTGLMNALLLTDLDQMELGDTFVLHVLGESLTYEVDQILTVLPDETEALQIEEGEDYCTLITCTPYGINTHRLLVRGHRIETAEEEPEDTAESAAEQSADTGIPAAMLTAFALVGAGAALLLILLVRGVRRRLRWRKTHAHESRWHLFSRKKK